LRPLSCGIFLPVFVHAARLLTAFATCFGSFFPIVGKVARVAALLGALLAGGFFVVSHDLSPLGNSG